MSRLARRRNFEMCSLALGALLLVAPSLLVVFAALRTEQQQSQPPPPPPTPPPSSQPAPDPAAPIGPLPVKRRKVWTNDDVVVLRTPADNYLAEKETREAAEAEAAARLAAQPKGAKEVPLETKLPTSVEETQLLIKNKEQDISDDQATLAGLNAELAAAVEEKKKAKQKEIEIVAAELDRAQNELKALQERLAELRRPPAREIPASPPPPN